MIKYFTLYGERCSGTNFLFHAIKKNFNLEYTDEYGNKHFFGYYDFNKETNNKEKENETLFIGIIRNPIEWIDSFIKLPHHLPFENKINHRSFLFNSFYSLYDDTKLEIMEDRNMNSPTLERYKNIFELRNVKADFLSIQMPKKVKNYLLIRYEDLRDNYENVLKFIEKKFDLKRVNKTFIKIEKYKGTREKNYYKKPLLINKNIIDLIKKNVNKEQENSLGYLV